MSDEMKPDNNQSNSPDKKVLLEKVREIEAQKREREAATAKSLERENTAKLLGEKMEYTPVMSDDEARRQMGRWARRDFLIGGAAAVLGYFGYSWLRAPEQAWVFERAFRFNENVSQAYYSTARLAPEFPREQAQEPRVNGGEGLSQGFDPATWRLQVVGLANPQNYSQYTDNIAYDTAMDNMNATDESSERHENQDSKSAPNAPMPPPETMDRAAATQAQMPGLLLTLDDIRALPRVEMTTELKCIEGWSTIVNWTGARFSDFAARFQPPAGIPYASLVTPDGGYYVGMDMPSMMHPQTLLAYEMNGAPLNLAHGAPLRLLTTTKYGIKQLKRIGRITFTVDRPSDFWAERGYDWYSGH